MMGWKRGRWLLLAMVGLPLGLAVKGDERPVPPRDDKPMPNFTLQGVDGKPVSLYSFAGKAGAVLFFTGNDCPVANKYLPRLVELEKTYGARGIVFLAINSNASESLEEVAAHAREHGITFHVLKDSRNVVADLARAERTSQVVVLDGRATVRYRGAIDDQLGQGVAKPAPSQNYLTDALDAILAKRAVEVASTTPVGCPIERVDRKGQSAKVRPAASAIVEALQEREKREGPIKVGPVTYAADVAPIVQAKCQSCHRAGQVGPFPLMGYDDVRKRAEGIAEVVEDRRMPPWHADPRFGHFSNDRGLTPRERATMLAWVEQGSPLGDASKLPPPRTFPEGWSIGTPDLVVEIPKANEVPPFGVLDYVDVTVPSNFDRDMWVQAAEIRPEVRSVVHHIIVYVIVPNAARREQREHLAAYVPGDTPTLYPEGIAKKVPAGSRLHFQIHYTPDGTAHTDRSKLGLVFAKSPVKHRAYTRFIQETRFEIPANDGNYEVTSTQTFRSPMHLYSLSPHMHLRGKDFKYTATYPDGRSEVLLSVPAYDFGWQSAYVLAEPKAIPKGTRIDCVAHFDNSSSNPANPDPTQVVRWGEQSSSEMMMGYLDYVDDAPSDWKP
jgi:peroxiredoxin/mono/diheme cytochrome c family protein